MADRESIIDVVRKCLALSRSSNEHEAARAAEKASELMLKYKLSEAEVELKTEAKVGVTHTEYPTVNREWRRSLANSVAHAYFCKVYCQRKRHNSLIYFVGKPTDIQITIIVYEWLAQQLDQICYDETKHDMGERGNLTSWRNSWLLGAVYVVDQRLREQRDRQGWDPNVTALVSTSNRELLAYANSTWNLRLGHVNYSQTPINSAAWAAGSRAGANVSLNRPTSLGNRGQLP